MVALEVNLKVSTPDVTDTSSAEVSYATVSTSPVQVVFSSGGKPAGTIIKPLALPYSSVVTSPLNADKELPAIPVNLRSGLTQRPISLPSKKTYSLVLGFIRLTTNLTGILLAKNAKEVDTRLSPIAFVGTPFPTSLFCGLILEELPTEALETEVVACCVLTSPRELIAVNEVDVPTQLTTKELKRLEKLSFTFSFAKKMLNRLVLVSTTSGSSD